MGESARFSGIRAFNLLFTCLSSHLAVLLTNTPTSHFTCLHNDVVVRQIRKEQFNVLMFNQF